MPIVTGYEDTPGGHDALVLGAQLARLTGLSAVVATVYPVDARGLAVVARDPRWREKARTVAAGRFRRAREIIGDGWGDAEPEFTALTPGSVADVLADHADDVGAAVLVVGSTGHGLLGRLAPGRTVQRLLPLARCPVAIAPRGYRHTGTGTMTVVAVAYDGSAEADRAMTVAVHLAGRTGAAVRVVSVAEDDAGVPAAQALAHKGIASLPVEVDALSDVVVGPVAATLAALPDRTDLLVVGSRGYRFMQRLLLGGVAGVLVRTARYPVVVVPGPDRAGTGGAGLRGGAAP
ncbi:universal stress protein [Pseudonocardia sp. KRD-184]|uniref:Universal stress protein n=1 Tax=Pseudonocardia oceani TaxID=2792013 RepID=A0ABS6U5E1_9PSEU|nr:universal stress protein [Pseudonocardia oceani]MBW0092758.1 universal stress protein [Pseudonocardia oceani]MBW0096151.1 universal stress protein [Pseudonocardia oceani]MBW0125555.1 universal stress protein [Pseudonocardia oceani]MBW0127124.1 universal stress protein [Pseudonocardia oceani]